MNPWLHSMPTPFSLGDTFHPSFNAFPHVFSPWENRPTPEVSNFNPAITESTSPLNPAWQASPSAPKMTGLKNVSNSHNFWEYKPPGTECEEEPDEKHMKKEFKEGKIAQYQYDNERKRDRRHEEKDRDRDRDRDKDRHKSRDRRSSSSPRNYEDSPRRLRSDRDSKHKERRSRDKDRQRSRDRDTRRDHSPREKRKRDDSSDRQRDDNRKRRDTSPRYREKDDRSSNKDNTNKLSDSETRYSLEAANYKTQSPNETIMIRGLAQHITENDIRADILQCGMMPKDIRLIRKKETGASRGFAFVEFNNVDEASYWMELKQGVLMFQDQYRAVMQFSIANTESVVPPTWLPPSDWDCNKCFTHNFKKRTSCFKCHAPRREASDGLECGNEISPHPTTKLILRNLDVLTNEEKLLKEISNVSNIPVQSCQIGRDSLTNLSKGVCYLEMKNVLESIKLFNALTATGLTIDGRTVNISYCKLNLDKPPTPAQWAPSTVGGAAVQASASGNLDQLTLQQYKLEDVPRLAEFSAQMYANTPQELASYLQYYTQYYTMKLTSQSAGAGTNVAAAVAQSAIRAAQTKKAVMSTHGVVDAVVAAAAAAAVATAAASQPPTVYMTSKQLIGNTSVGEPDVSSYTYDETSGYFFDARTGLYYDANSQYYYHSQDQVFLYWDSEKKCYMAAPTDGASAGATAGATGDGNKDDKKKDKNQEKCQDKVKVAKRIAKDMERWAKTLNQKKEIAKMNAVAVQAAQTAARAASTADIAYAVLERKESLGPIASQFDSIGRQEEIVQVQQQQQSQQQQQQQQQQSQSNLVASYGGGSDSDDNNDDSQSGDPQQYLDWTKMACLLCKRQFPNRDALSRHQQLSDLHKQNLDAWNKSRGFSNQSGGAYRDRAKERREKFGIPDEPKPNRLKEKYLKVREEVTTTSYEEPNKTGISSENKGNRMLQKMGWSEGMGLGRSNQGRTDIIEPTHRVASAGLGVKGGNLGTGTVPMGATYQEKVKRSMMARYSELN